jgi:hypothetical protein
MTLDFVELAPPLLVTDSTSDAVAPPLGKRCRYRGCGRPATAVAVIASESSYPVKYCETHGRLVERLGRHVTYFPVCAEQGCDELASTLALVETARARSEWLLVCDAHRRG